MKEERNLVKKQSAFLSPRVLLASLGIAAALMLLGSFVDYPLSCALYNETNPFAMFFAAYGEIPATLGLVAAGSLLLCGRNRQNRILGVSQCVGGTLLVLSGTLMICFMPTMYLPVSPVILAVVGLALSAGTIILVLRLARGADRAVLVRAAAAVFFVILCEMVLVNCIKAPWGRPRMRLVASNAEACFLPWWQMGGAMKDNLIAAGVASEEFKSFPSGHTANATVMLLLGLIPYLKPQLQKFRNLFLAIGFTWAGVVAFTRIVMGAHYLTDTVAGFVISLLCVYGICTAMFRRTKI